MLYLNGSTVIIQTYTRVYFHPRQRKEGRLSRDSPDDFHTRVNIDAFPASLQTQSRGAGRCLRPPPPSVTALIKLLKFRPRIPATCSPR
jgi:hypothetical protein